MRPATTLAARPLPSPDEPDFWREYAAVYETVLRRFSPYGELLRRIARSQASSRRILDVGCGPGIVAERLARGTESVVGVDSSEAMLAAAAPKAGPNLSFRRMDAGALDFPDGSFDGVVCNNVLYFVEDPEDVLSEIHRVLAPGGLLSLSSPRRGFEMARLHRRLAQELADDPDPRLRAALARFLEFNDLLADEGGLRNLYDDDEILALAMDRAGFREEVEHRSVYLGQSFFLVLRK